MTINLFNNKSDLRYLNKTYELIQTTNAEIYGECNIDSVSLLLDYNENLSECNFFEIPSMHRFYYTTGIVLQPGKKCILTGEIDVLETFKPYIKNLDCIINRQEHAGLTLLPDSNVMLKNDTIKNIYASSEKFETMYGSYILTVLGGV